MHRLLLIYLVFSGALYSADGGCRVRDILRTIPKEDQKEISDFFRGILSHDDMASVLIGDKPSGVTSITSWLTGGPNELWESMFLEYRGWIIWKKYSDQFPLKVAFKEEYDEREAIHLWVVKKEYEGDLEHFLKIKPSGIMERKKIGLLLGYPEEAVTGFIKMQSIEATLTFFPYEIDGIGPLNGVDPKDLIRDSSIDLSGLIEEMKRRFTIVHSWKKEGPFFCSIPYTYRAFSKPNPSDGESFKEHLAKVYNSDNFLEEVLQLLAIE